MMTSRPPARRGEAADYEDRYSASVVGAEAVLANAPSWGTERFQTPELTVASTGDLGGSPGSPVEQVVPVRRKLEARFVQTRRAFVLWR